MEAGVRIGWVRLRAWELTVEKAEVEVVASGERGGCVVCKAAAAAGSESRGLRSTNHVQDTTVHHCPMSVRWSCARAPSVRRLPRSVGVQTAGGRGWARRATARRGGSGAAGPRRPRRAWARGGGARAGACGPLFCWTWAFFCSFCSLVALLVAGSRVPRAFFPACSPRQLGGQRLTSAVWLCVQHGVGRRKACECPTVFGAR